MSVREAAKIAQRIAQEMQYELIDVELVKEPTGHFLRFYVDRTEAQKRETGEGITLNELEAFHRRIMPLVESVAYDYMEVSSPGADRPLKTDRDFERAAGTVVELKTYRPVNGAKQFTGELVGLVDDQVVLRTKDGERDGERDGEDSGELRFPRRDVALVRPLIEFDEEDLQDDAPQGQG